MPPGSPELVLVGHPNVGKSRLFNLLTKKQVAVSNYPGTTVELAHGKGKINGLTVTVVDTPGLYSLEAISPEEQVTRLILVEKRPALVIQVADARNLPRMLGLTLELLEAEVPLLLVLNMMDEAKASGITINSNLLSRRLGSRLSGSVDFRTGKLIRWLPNEARLWQRQCSKPPPSLMWRGLGLPMH